MNAKGGVDGRPIELVLFDDASNPAVARAGIRRRWPTAHASPCSDIFLSSTSLAAAPAYKDAQIPALTGSAAADDLLAHELRRQEELEVRLVPHRPERDRSVTLAAVVPRRKHFREGREIAEPGGHHVRCLPPVCPLRRPVDVDHHAEAVETGLVDELVEVPKLVGGVVTVRRSAGLVGARPGQLAVVWMTDAPVALAC